MRRSVKSRLVATAIIVITSGLAWLAQDISRPIDLSTAARNQLSPAVKAELQQLTGPLTLTAGLRDDPLIRRKLRAAVGLIQAVKPDSTLTITLPETTAEGVTSAASLTLQHQGRRSTIYDLNQQSLLHGLQGLKDQAPQWLVFLQGHGERDPADNSPTGLSQLEKLAAQQGYRSLSLDLNETANIPDNTALLVIAGARSDLETSELSRIESYLDTGGHLLWLLEPHSGRHWHSLADQLSLALQPGTLMSEDSPLRTLLGLQHPAQISVSRYNDHPALRNFDQTSLFTVATALDAIPSAQWQATTLFSSRNNSWSDLGQQPEQMNFDQTAGDLRGPLTLAVAATRTQHQQQQRIVVIGDSSFASNEYLAMSGNQALSQQLLTWLMSPATLDIQVTSTSLTSTLDADNPRLLQLASVILFGLPGTALLIAAMQWWRLRERN